MILGYLFTLGNERQLNRITTWFHPVLREGDSYIHLTRIIRDKGFVSMSERKTTEGQNPRKNKRLTPMCAKMI
jgi:hypothetical protein